MSIQLPDSTPQDPQATGRPTRAAADGLKTAVTLAEFEKSGADFLLLVMDDRVVFPEHALARLLQDEDLRRSMGRANRERVKIFEPDAVGSRYLSTLEAILARPDHS